VKRETLGQPSGPRKTKIARRNGKPPRAAASGARAHLFKHCYKRKGISLTNILTQGPSTRKYVIESLTHARSNC